MTAVEVDRENTVLRVRVTGEVRFCENDEAGDAARRRKRVPARLMKRMEIEIANYAIEQFLQQRETDERIATTTRRVDEPLGADFHRTIEELY